MTCCRKHGTSCPHCPYIYGNEGRLDLERIAQPRGEPGARRGARYPQATVRPPFPCSPGREGQRQAFVDLLGGDPGYHRIDDQIAESDKVLTRLTTVRKHEGDLPGAPRTGNDLQMTSITIHRIVDGKLVEKWAEKDGLGFLPQIGVMPAPDHATG